MVKVRDMDTQQVIKRLKQIVKPKQILTDPEDLYVYSFEKIFEKQKPKPDVVVKTLSSKEAKEILELAEKEGFTVIRRDEMIDRQSMRKPLVLLDDVLAPELKRVPAKRAEITEILKEIREKGHGSPRNLALALKALFLEKNLAKCGECKTCSGYCTVTSSFEGVETWSWILLILRGSIIGWRGRFCGLGLRCPFRRLSIDLLFHCLLLRVRRGLCG